MNRRFGRAAACLIALLAVLIPVTAAQADNPAYSGAVLDDTPLGYWRLDGTSTTSAADATGHGYVLTGGNGVTAGAGLTAGVVGPMPGTTGVAFSGGSFTRAYFNYATNFAMEAWARSDQSPANARQAIVSNGWVGSSDNCWHGALVVGYNNSAGGYDANTCSDGGWAGLTATFGSTSDWHHLVLNRVGGTTSFYVDGVLRGTDTHTVTLGGGGFRIGSFQDTHFSDNNATAAGSFGPFRGAISNVAFYNHTLTVARIAAHYNAAVGAPANTALPTASPSTLLGPGLTVTAGTGSWTGADLGYAYQWLRCDASGGSCSDISGATSSTYTLTDDDAGRAVRVRVTATSSAGGGTATSAATDAVAVQTPHGQSLYAQTVLGDTPLGYWRLDGTSTASAADATGHGYGLTGGNGVTTGAGLAVGALGPMNGALGVVFSGGSFTRAYFNYATNFAMEAWARSDQSPANARQAIVSNGWVGSSDNCWHGALVVGYNNSAAGYDANTCGDGGWAWATPTFSSTTDWHHLVLNRVGGTTSFYVDGVLRGTDAHGVTLGGGGFRIGSFQDTHFSDNNATAAGSFGPFRGAISNVAYYNHTLTAAQITAHYDAARGLPTNTTRPAIAPATGLHPGDAVTATTGTWAGAGTITYAYQWQVCDTPSTCAPIAGATGSSYTLTAAAAGKTVKVVVTAANALGSASIGSARTDAVTAALPTNTALPTISGDPTDGATLTSTVGTWDGATPIDHARQWQRCNASGSGCDDIPGATAASYDLTSADVGHTLRVTVTATNTAGSASATSAATDVVAAVAPSNGAAPTVAGTPAHGEVLTATTGTWSGTAPITYTYSWSRCDASGDACDAIAGSDDAQYVVGDDDVRRTLRVTVTATNAAGSDTATSAPTARVAAPADAVDPEIALAGDVVDLEGEELPSGYHVVDVTATDAGGSGVTRLETLVDDSHVDDTSQECPDGGCALTRHVLLNTEDYTAGDHELRVVATDADGNDATETLTLKIPATAPDRFPEPLAPPVKQTEATTLEAASSFLYQGDEPIQSGVQPDTIAPERAAVIRGSVTDVDGEPLGGVEASIAGHPELGTTTSRDDGSLSFAVNGGGELTVRFEKRGYLTVERSVHVPWQDYAFIDDVALTALDTKVTAVDLSSPLSPAQVARGSEVTDDDGTRQSTVLFHSGTQASMVMPDGSTQDLPRLDVRSTEFTVGDEGQAAMPGVLPPESGYTYAAELSVDQAEAAGATEVRFNRPVVTYTDNFIGFPVGSLVPAGYYDEAKHAWIASRNGRVIKVLSESDGLAAIDVDGSGDAASATALDALGVDAEELRRLASLYAPGAELWRVPVTHFTPWDFNWPWGPPPNREVPNPRPDDPDQPDNPCGQRGSIISCESQTLGEELDVAGTDVGLRYQSERQAGDSSDRVLDLELIGDDVPDDVNGVTVDVYIAGKQIHQTLNAEPHLKFHYVWDGRDAFGRRVNGAHTASVTVGFLYDAVYYPAASDFQASFGLPGGSGAFSGYGGGLSLPARGTQIGVTNGLQMPLGKAFTSPSDLGGWNLDVHHVYDPGGHTLYEGDGNIRSAESIMGARAISAPFAGNGEPDGALGDDGPKAAASFSLPQDLAPAPDGSTYVADLGHNRVRRIARDGKVTTVAGNGEAPAFNGEGDGGPATEAPLQAPRRVTVGPDGSLYILDGNGLAFIRRVAPDGTISTVAGTPPPPPQCPPDCGGPVASRGTGGTATATAEPRVYDAEGGSALDAILSYPTAIAAAPDGSIYVAELSRVRKISPDGHIATVAGTGSASGALSAHARALDYRVRRPSDLAVAPDGTLYIALEESNRVVRVGADGMLDVVAGNGDYYSSGDGGSPTEAGVNDPQSIALGPDGSLLIAEYRAVVRRVSDGRITTVAGRPSGSSGSYSGPAAAVRWNRIRGLTYAPDGSWLFTDDEARVFRISSFAPGFDDQDITVASEDGTSLYQFSAEGRHLRTLDTATGSVEWTFHYDAQGRLTEAIDGDGQATTIERDADGSVDGIVGPHGQKTEVFTDADGFITELRDPDGNDASFEYDDGGLLTAYDNPAGGHAEYGYDAEGRLIRDDDGVGGVKTLVASKDGDDRVVTFRDGLGHATTYKTQALPEGGVRRVVQADDGAETTIHAGVDGRQEIQTASGLTITPTFTSDPRFGMQAPVRASSTVTTPSGLGASVTKTSAAALANSANPLSVEQLTDTTTINGKAYTSVFDRSSRTLTTTTPLGRATTLEVDEHDRPVAQTRPGLEAETQVYDSEGNPTELTQGDRTWHYEWTQGSLTAVVDPAGGRTELEQDSAGRVVKVRDPGGRVVRYSYDALGNVESVTPPGRSAHVRAHDEVGRQTDATAPSGANTSYDWRADGRLDGITRPDGRAVDYRYDTHGRFTGVTTPAGATTMSYAAAGARPSTIAGPTGEGLDLSWDGPLLTGTTFSGTVAGVVAQTYDANLRVASTSVRGDVAAVGYDDDGLLVQAGSLTLDRDADSGALTGTHLGAVATAEDENGYGELSEATASYDGDELLGRTYERDLLGRVSKVTETGTGSRSGDYEYRYDNGGRLVEVKHDGDVTESYTYDDNGNRLSRTVGGQAQTATYDGDDRLVSQGDVDYTYTGNGEVASATNSVSGAATTYRYDALGTLQGAHVGTKDIDYVVDPLGRRIAKKVDGQLTQGFLYGEMPGPVAELDDTGAMVSRFVYGSLPQVPEYMEHDGSTYRLVVDHIGSVRKVVDVDTGAVAQELAYDAYGNVVLDTNPGFQPFGFAGGLYDRDTKLVHFSAREYDPATGRWTASDPIGFEGGDSNLYGYVLGDPVNGIDPAGTDLLDWARDRAGDAADALGTAAQQVQAFNAGFMDEATFGLTQELRSAFWGEERATFCGTAYTAGRVTNAVVGSLTPEGMGKNLLKTAIRIPGRSIAKKLAKELEEGVARRLAKSESRHAEPPPIEKKRGGESPAAAHGRDMHEQYDWGDPDVWKKEQRLDGRPYGLPNMRADVVNYNERIIGELKPNKPDQIRRGERQLEKQRQILEKLDPTIPGDLEKGKPWTVILRTYEPYSAP